MVRACQLEEDISAYVEGLLQKRIAAEVGLLVGKLGSGTRNFILLLIKSPQQNGVEPVLVSTASTSSKKTASKGRSAAPTVQVQLDDEWLAVHAHNVSRMLPGGLSVIGLYLFCPESGLAGVTGQLTNALQCIGSASLPQGDQAGDMLLLHIASDSRKWSLKELPPASSNKAAALRPCEIRHVPLAANFAGISCRMAVDLAVPVTSDQPSLGSLFGSAIHTESQRIKAGIASWGGKIPAPEQTLADALASSQDSSQAAGQAVDLLCPPRCAATGAAAKPDKADPSGVTVQQVFGQVQLRGMLDSRAYVHKRETVATAVDCLKEDLAASLKARLDLILLEDGEDGAEGPFSRAVAKSGAICVPLPARVFFPVKGDIMLCDYLAPGETEADARERCNEMLALQIVKVHCVEVVASSQAPDAWDPLKTVHSTATADAAHATMSSRVTADAAPAPMSSRAMLALGATAVAALAAAAGYMMLD